MLEIYRPPVDRLKTRETYLEKLHAEIREQAAGSIKVLLFLNSHRRDLLSPYDFLRADMVMAGLLPITSKLAEIFPISENVFDRSPDPRTIVRFVKRELSRMSVEDVKKRWFDFIAMSEKVLAAAPKAEKVEVVGWLMGPDMSPFESGRNFLSPTQKGLEWPFRDEVPPLQYLANWLVSEHGRKSAGEIIDRWLGLGKRQAEVADEVDTGEAERIFGPRGPVELFDLLPPSLQKAVDFIFIVDSLENEEIDSDEETTELHEDVEGETVLNLNDDEEATVADVEKKVSAIDLVGQLDKASRTLVLVVNKTSRADKIVGVWFHELGHAVIAGKSLIDQAIRRRFLEAVVSSNGLPIGYVSDSYEKIGIARGLEEDFAEALRNYCLFPREFKKTESERFAAIQEILAKYFPDFDLTRVQKKVSTFLKNTDGRA